MVQVFFSTVFRYAPIDQAGELIELDWKKKEIINKVSVSPKMIQINDPNPRGNSRGARGIAIIENIVIVATYCELQVYDRHLNHLYDISHPLMVGLHEVFHTNDQKIWITSTAICSALQIDLKTGQVVNQYWPREMSEFQEQWSLKPLEINKNEDNRLRFLSEHITKDPSHLHFNAIAVWQGQEFGLFNRFGTVVNLSTKQIVVQDSNLRGAHNLIILHDGTIFVNDTRNQAVCIYDMNGRLKKRIDLLPFHSAGKKAKWYKKTAFIRGYMEKYNLLHYAAVMPFFVRGMDILDDLLFVGISPAAILCVNWRTGKLIDVYNYSSDTRIAVHGLKVLV